MMLVETAVSAGLACELCGDATVPIPASHSSNRPPRAYECLACGHEQARVVPVPPARASRTSAVPPALRDVA